MLDCLELYSEGSSGLSLWEESYFFVNVDDLLLYFCDIVLQQQFLLLLLPLALKQGYLMVSGRSQLLFPQLAQGLFFLSLLLMHPTLCFQLLFFLLDLILVKVLNRVHQILHFLLPLLSGARDLFVIFDYLLFFLVEYKLVNPLPR